MEQTQHIHFIAIGGAAMHNLAIALHKNGNIISGSDDSIFDPAKSKLQQFGLLPDKEGWFPEKIHKNLDCIILGMHARIDNPELCRANEMDIPIYSFPEYIFKHSKNKKRIVIGGSHGKTTITAMILHVMRLAGIESDYLAGAAIPGFDDSVSLSDDANYMVIEGDEYLTSPIDPRPKFHLYKPHIAVISGIAYDHINVFKTWEEYVRQFEIFISLIEPKGILFYYQNDNELVKIAKNIKEEIQTAHYEIPDYEVIDGITWIGNTVKVPLQVFGEHNLANISAALSVCKHIGIDENDFYKYISSFQGANNRLTKVFETPRHIVYRDFAHAPSKVNATVKAVRKQYPNKYFIACLELHTFSSLSAEFLPYYKGSMADCDVPILYYNPQAVLHKRLPLPEFQIIIDGFQQQDMQIFTDSSLLQNTLVQLMQDNDCVLLMMSSGNFNNLNMHTLQTE
jgi:UDP-N-acetylmuramate: L-alanyl-gamma-D-glutamyl-meso-diaminopimelate ligase